MSNIYKQSLNRKQQQFFPPSLDEYVSEDNQVRAIEDYVELLGVLFGKIFHIDEILSISINYFKKLT